MVVCSLAPARTFRVLAGANVVVGDLRLPASHYFFQARVRCFSNSGGSPPPIPILGLLLRQVMGVA